MNANRKTRRSQRGALLGVVAVMLVGMSGLAVALMRVTKSSGAAQRHDREDTHARYIANAGLANAMFRLQSGQQGALGTAQAPVQLDKSHYYVQQEFLAADVIRLTSTGLDDQASARLELVVRQLPTTVWRFGAFGREFLHMDANARVDSFNSDLGTYTGQAVTARARCSTRTATATWARTATSRSTRTPRSGATRARVRTTSAWCWAMPS